MTFTGTSLDVERLVGASFGVTAATGFLPVADALVLEMEAEPVHVAEEARPLYHAALAHASNHLVTLEASSADLLKVARACLRERVMPQVEADARYDAAMVANAMAIAIRELELGPRARADERELLGRFLGQPDATLDRLRRELCRELRRPGFALEHAAELRALLERLVHARLAISNPAYPDTLRP